MKDNYIVYVHIAPNEKLYIGITRKGTKQRWRNSGIGYKSQQLFWRAIQKYGWNNFKHIVLLENLSKDVACECEKYLISKYKSNNSKFGYNIYIGGNEGNRSVGLTDKQRQRLIIANTGKKLSDETKQKISNALKGRKQTPEHIQHVSDAKRGIKLSNEHRENLSKSHIGKKLTTAQKEKQSKALKSYMQSLTSEQRKQIYGHSMSSAIPVSLYINDVYVKDFDTSKDCAKYINKSTSYVCRLISGKIKSKQYRIIKHI